jgi:hypothetical protein
VLTVVVPCAVPWIGALLWWWMFCSVVVWLQFITRSIGQYKKFLYMHAKYRSRLWYFTPPWQLDVAWHAHQIHPVWYESDCHKICGRFLAHVPWLADEQAKVPGDPATATRNDAADLWVSEFGEKIWD